MINIKENVSQFEGKFNQALKKGERKSSTVQVVAVIKNSPIQLTKEIIQEGFNHLAENRPEGLLEKQNELNNQNITWHFIGNLQTRKVKEIINRIDFLHSLDRLSLAKEIEKRAENSIACFVQVNISGENSKSGIHPDKLEEFITQLADYPKIKIIGLMTMAPLLGDETVIRSVFSRLKICQEQIAKKKLPYAPCTELSMGMSGDYQIAIEEGATYIRIGSSFFKSN
ncbi:YggS family pyridoxal phosphate-dependent enzyme [Carnobacterium funditum]|uniref:YggS family pyridoxal phosphate-dependent enzyme n=1 Tax=Carnobacterium funditum TaxID=2752 RepID=UPI00055222C0|nr:YggS family pyridoxal phosphate-dependent enzyme [Carnobacterium funditum]